MDDILTWLADSWVGVEMHDLAWLFPAFETLHFMGLCVLFGATLMLDMRILGVARFMPMKAVLSFIPLALGAFCVNLITGIGFFCYDPFRYYPNIAFRWKMFLILAAGANALWFWLAEHERMKRLPDGEDAGIVPKFIACLSLAIWISVIIMGRMIPYVE